MTSAPPRSGGIQPDRSRLLLIMIRPTRPTLAEVPLADLSFEPGSRKLLYDWGESRGPDGIKQDIDDRLSVAGGTNESKPPFEPDNSRPRGVSVIDPTAGTLLAFLPVPTDEVTNFTFGGADGRDLYVAGGGRSTGSARPRPAG
jgi:sugar lactone lactonase YvrE